MRATRPTRPWARLILTAALGAPLFSIATSSNGLAQEAPLRHLTRFHSRWIPGDTLPGPGLQLHQKSTDRDGDGLTNAQETQGWLIVVDEVGYGAYAPAGLLTIRHVYSDPDKRDTDGDGLNDWEEFLIKSDPTRQDTDGDGLNDRAEWRRWLTTPNSVDTDADSRGVNHDAPPNASLFDWAEIYQSHTSPTLEDTDGDGRTDEEELDDPSVSPLIAELPRAEVNVVGNVDVRLSVEYAESIGSASEYGVSLSESEASSQGSSKGGSKSESFASHQETSMDLSVGGEVEWGLPPSVTGTINVTEGESSGTSSEVGNEENWSATKETSTAAETAHSNYQSDSSEFSETYSSGSIRTGIQIRNDGPVTFTLTNLGLAVLNWERDSDQSSVLNGGFKTMGTLLPQIDSFTLAPGQSTPVLEASTTDVNASIIKGFLSNPSSLVFQPSSFDLQDADGIDFDFITETTFSRTALIEVNYGGDDVSVYRIATNVERSPGGGYLGVSMKTVMQDILQIPYTVEEVFNHAVDPPVGTGVRVLASVNGRQYENPPSQGVLPTAFWTLISEDFTAGTLTSFEDLRIRAGDHVRLVYTRDNDRDGVFEIEEEFFGSSDAQSDSDFDGVEDYIEVKQGWIAGVDPVNGTELTGFGYPKRVHSDPRFADGDHDGLDDAAELAAGTDPTHPDTDRDTVLDGADPNPLIPARRVYVAQEPNSGWLAHTDLGVAIAAARQSNTNEDPTDDVAEIWVARGSYRPAISDPSSAFDLYPGVAIYGGFLGGETKRGQRDSNPLTNQTTLSGEGQFPATDADNSFHVVRTAPDCDTSAALDGFAIVAGRADGETEDLRRGGGMLATAPVTLRNLLFFDNYATHGGGGLYSVGGNPADHSIQDSYFIQNRTSATEGYGAGLVMGDGGAVLDCVVSQNGPASYGGGIHVGERHSSGATVVPSYPGRIERCTIANNTASLSGAGVWTSGGQILDCDIITNSGPIVGAGVYYSAPALSSPLAIANCRIWNNSVSVISGHWRGGGVYASAESGSGSPELRVINSTIASNLGQGIFSTTTVSVRNSILWGNTEPGGGSTFEEAQLEANLIPSDQSFSVIQGLSSLFGPGLLGSNPGFVDLASGNLRLSAGSPCIDTGTNFVDMDPRTPGFQPLPELDLDGNARLSDGDGFGGATVDMGAYERQ